MPNPQPDLTLREQVALRLGWKRLPSIRRAEGLPPIGRWEKHKGCPITIELEDDGLAPFNESFAAAEAVLDWLTANGWSFKLVGVPGHYSCDIWTGVGIMFEASAATLPLAICLAVSKIDQTTPV